MDILQSWVVIQIHRSNLLFWFLLLAVFSLSAVEPEEVIINEVYYWPKGPVVPGHNETVELLVVADQINVNGLQVSDRDVWDKATEGQCTLQDLGQGFLKSVRSGTLIVIHRGEGKDDTDGSDFVLRFYARSSRFCNTAPTTNSFELSNHDDNLHVLHHGKQVDFLKYRASNPKEERSHATSGSLGWDGGEERHIPIGKVQDNTGIRFLGNEPELNDYPASWLAYSEPYLKDNNIGKPNGGANTVWIEGLRKAAKAK